jgi:hypothetical protein
VGGRAGVKINYAHTNTYNNPTAIINEKKTTPENPNLNKYKVRDSSVVDDTEAQILPRSIPRVEVATKFNSNFSGTSPNNLNRKLANLDETQKYSSTTSYFSQNQYGSISGPGLHNVMSKTNTGYFKNNEHVQLEDTQRLASNTDAFPRGLAEHYRSTDNKIQVTNNNNVSAYKNQDKNLINNPLAQKINFNSSSQK